MNALQEKVSASHTLSGTIWNVLVRKMLKKPKLLPLQLMTWEPSMKESEKLLQLLTEKMSPKWWMKINPSVRYVIMRELVRIDDGRGVIGDWLTLIVREENEPLVLSKVYKWKPKMGGFPSGLLDAWCEKSFSSDDSNIIALGTMVEAILPSNMSSGCEDGRTWNEERRAEIIRQHLSKHVRYRDTDMNMNMKEMEYMATKLEILARWKPSPELHGKKILSEIFCEWEKHMQDIARVMARVMEDNIHNKSLILVCERYLYATWEGLKKLSPYCADADGKILFWMDHWLQRKDLNDLTALRLREEMLGWNPLDTLQRKQAAVLWSRQLLSSNGYRNRNVWATVGRYVTECLTPGDGTEEICRNCLAALGLVAEIPDEFKTVVMEAIVCPPWLTKEQQGDWERLWVSMMQSSFDKDVVRAATHHLLGLVTNGLADANAVKETILKRAASLNTGLNEKNEKRNVWATLGLLNAIAEWESNLNLREEMFHEIWVQLRQSPSWEEWDIRAEASEVLGAYLMKNLAQGGAATHLVSLWLETLSEERDYGVIFSLPKEQFIILNVQPGFYPASVEVFRRLVRSEEPRIRRKAWQFFFSLKDELKDEIGGLVLEMLKEEKDLDVLYVMAKWKPSPGKPFPAGFREAWENCFQGIVTDAGQSYVSGQIKNYDLEYRLGKIISVWRDSISTFVVAWLEEQPGSDIQSAKLADLQAFSETFCKTMAKAVKFFPGMKMGGKIEEIQKNTEALLRLSGPPEEFVNFFAEATEEITYESKMKWDDLLETFKDWDVKSLPANVRHNLSVAAAFLLSVDSRSSLEDERRKMVENIFVALAGDGTWTPNRIPAGWKEFCRRLHRLCTEYDKENNTEWEEAKKRKMEKVCAMIRTGHTISDQRWHHLFFQKLGGLLKSAKPDIAAVAENAVWAEVVRVCEIVERLSPDGKELDEAGRQRWMREFLQSHGRTSSNGKGGKGIQEFLNALRVELEDELFPRKTKEDRRKSRVEALTLDDGKAVFVHPHLDRKCPVENPDRLVETEPVGRRARQLSFFFAE